MVDDNPDAADPTATADEEDPLVEESGELSGDEEAETRDPSEDEEDEPGRLSSWLESLKQLPDRVGAWWDEFRGDWRAQLRKHVGLPSGVHLLLIVTMLGFLSGYAWLFDLLSHWRPHLAVVGAGWAVLLILARRTVYTVLCTVVAGINFALLLPLWFGPTAMPVPDSTPIKVIMVNVGEATDKQAIGKLLMKERPHVVVLIEVDQSWLDALHGPLWYFPQKVTIPREGNFGISLHTRARISRVHQHDIGPMPTIAVDIEFWGKEVTVVATHPVPPVSSRLWEQRNEQLESVANARPLFQDTLIVAGDLNTTSWSAPFHKLVNRANLLDSRDGFGIQVSWHAPFGAPIDHVLHSPDLVTTRRELGADFGSDHRPVIVEMAPAVVHGRKP